MPSGMNPNMRKWIEQENGGVSRFDGKRQHKLFGASKPPSSLNTMPCAEKDHLCPYIVWNREITIMTCKITMQPCDYAMERIPHPMFPNGFQVFVKPVKKCPNFKKGCEGGL